MWASRGLWLAEVAIKILARLFALFCLIEAMGADVVGMPMEVEKDGEAMSEPLEPTPLGGLLQQDGEVLSEAEQPELADLPTFTGAMVHDGDVESDSEVQVLVCCARFSSYRFLFCKTFLQNNISWTLIVRVVMPTLGGDQGGGPSPRLTS